MSATVKKVKVTKNTVTSIAAETTSKLATTTTSDFYTVEVEIQDDTTNSVARAQVTFSVGKKPQPTPNPVQCYETGFTTNIFQDPSVTFSSNAVGITYNVAVVLYSDSNVIISSWSGSVTVA